MYSRSSSPSATNVTEAYARDGDGKIDISGDGQVNFKVNTEEGYVIDTVAAAPEGNYKNLKGAEDTKVEGIYRLTKVKDSVTVTVTTKEEAGSETPEEPEEPDYTPVVTSDTRV